MNGLTQALRSLTGERRRTTLVDMTDNYPQVVYEGPCLLHGAVVTTVLSAHAVTVKDDTVTAATPAVNALGAFTAGAGGDTDSQFRQSLDNSDGRTLVITSTPAQATATAATVAAGYVAAGFTAAGAGTVAGYSLDLGAAATIAAAITAGSLSIVREDGVEFSTTESIVGTAFGVTTPTFAADTSPTTSGVLAAVDSVGQNVGGVPASSAVGTAHNMLSQKCEYGIVVVPGNASATGILAVTWEPLPTY